MSLRRPGQEPQGPGDPATAPRRATPPIPSPLGPPGRRLQPPAGSDPAARPGFQCPRPARKPASQQAMRGGAPCPRDLPPNCPRSRRRQPGGQGHPGRHIRSAGCARGDQLRWFAPCCSCSPSCGSNRWTTAAWTGRPWRMSRSASPGSSCPSSPPASPCRQDAREPASRAGRARPRTRAAAPGPTPRRRPASNARGSTVTEKVAETQERIRSASRCFPSCPGKGPATQRRHHGVARPRPRGGGLVDFGGLEDKLANLEGLTKFDSKSTVNNGGNRRAMTAAGALAGIDKMVKGFQNAKVGDPGQDRRRWSSRNPSCWNGTPEYTGDRSMTDVGAFISKKQSVGDHALRGKAQDESHPGGQDHRGAS